MNASSAVVSVAASCKPSTNFAYSSCSLAASVSLILSSLGWCPEQRQTQYLLVNLLAEFRHTPRGRIEHWSREVNAEGFYAYIV